MEDCNPFIADCVVLSCCCQCLVLQLLAFLLLGLPRKMVRKTREYAKKKLRKRRNKGEKHVAQARDRQGVDEVMHEWGDCMGEVEKVFEELSRKGEFAFGSFWGKENVEIERVMCCGYNPKELDYGGHLLNFQFIQVVAVGLS